MKLTTRIALLAVIIIGSYALTSAIYTVSEVEQMIITQFGKPVGEPVTSAGLKVKVPFIQEVNPIDKRVLEWDGNPSDMPTKDKLYISVDLFARWRITDPLQYFLRLRDERSAQSRLDDILGSETRNAVAKHELIEIIRTTRDRKPLRDALLTEAERDMGALVPIQKGRKLVEQEIFIAAAEKVRVFGIELLGIRFKRINYNESVRPKIYDRMISERRQIAERFLSEGNGEAARIRGNRGRDLNKIQSEAYRQGEEIRGVRIAVEVHIAIGRAPCAEQVEQVGGVHIAVVVEVGRALFFFAFIGDAVAVGVLAGSVGDVAFIGNAVAVAVLAGSRRCGLALDPELVECNFLVGRVHPDTDLDLHRVAVGNGKGELCERGRQDRALAVAVKIAVEGQGLVEGVAIVDVAEL